MKNRTVKRELFINKSLENVFAFFSDASNLNIITPPWLHFEIITPTPIPMQLGTRIDYRLRLHKIPVNWKTEITVWEPPNRFIDSQIKGPYAVWIHEHRFVSQNGGTLMTDFIEYRSRGFIFEPLIHHLFVKNDVQKIFDYREKRFKEIFKS
jgi:ligand-binding SRPBCC domain-containing protein